MKKIKLDLMGIINIVSLVVLVIILLLVILNYGAVKGLSDNDGFINHNENNLINQKGAPSTTAKGGLYIPNNSNANLQKLQYNFNTAGTPNIKAKKIINNSVEKPQITESRNRYFVTKQYYNKKNNNTR